jgi:putative ABC transport system permease protein
MASHFAVRTVTEPTTLIPAIRKVLWSLDRATIPPEMMMLENSFQALVQPRRTFLHFLAFSAATGLALAAIGIYGVLAHAVGRRIREIGVRMALGAQKLDVLRMVLKQGTRLITAGVGLGVAGSLVAGRLLQSKLFGTSAADPVTLVVVSALLALVGLCACWLPARRATQIDPMVALRYE